MTTDTLAPAMTIGQMKVGDIRYTVPWAVWHEPNFFKNPSNFSHVHVNTHYECSAEPNEERCVLLLLTESGFEITIPEPMTNFVVSSEHAPMDHDKPVSGMHFTKEIADLFVVISARNEDPTPPPARKPLLMFLPRFRGEK